MDYLSTVSGGGYIGASLSATTHASGGDFAFDHQQGRTGPRPSRDITDTLPVRHIRNHSKYLVARGFWDLMEDLALVARGMVTNALIVAPYLMLFAAVTLAYNPTWTSLGKFGPEFAAGWITVGRADGWAGALTWPASVMGVAVVFCLTWSHWRSLRIGAREREFPGTWSRIGAWLMLVLLAFVLLTAQNQLLAWLEPVKVAKGHAAAAPTFFHQLRENVGKVLLAATAYTGLVGFFRDQLIRSARDEAAKASALIGKIASTVALLLAALIVPLLHWLAYLAVVYFGLQHGDFCTAGCMVVSALPAPYQFPVALALAALAGLVLTAFIAPNSYSLHGLYRDRLERAFLFDPDPARLDPLGNLTAFAPRLRMSSLASPARAGGISGPFPLMNATLNVQGSAKVNRRGRNADFFVFSPLHAGSPATGYVAVTALEQCEQTLDLAAVTAISGAAASSNMGANTIRPLAMTLALLNVRLGYWLPNPSHIVRNGYRKSLSDWFYLWSEMTSQLDEKHALVYLTDGGHIENLGVYELLRRRCKVIVAVDAEADPAMSFGALVTLQRYARIDMGVRIDLPWAMIAQHTSAIMAANAAGTTPDTTPGPQVTLGTIRYDNGIEGVLVYIKASLSGAENDYVRAYARRNPSFPHETTADQFFSEEQLEAYRALGFAAAHAALDAKADIIALNGTGPPITAKLSACRQTNALARTLVQVLGL
jgi:hypothetical protein